MKKCPFCKADIEDNARFCLYCMKPLTEKEVVAPPREKKRRWLALLIGALAVALIVIFLFAGGENAGETPNETDAPKTTKTTEATPAPSSEAEPTEDTSPTDSTEDTTLPQPCNHSYTYQEDANGELVITGVQERSPDGIYEIPAHIDGKRVVEIMSLAFSGTDAREITLGENIRRVNQNAFAGCVNIQALYVKSDSLFLSRSAFVDASRRNCTLKIYCSGNCTVDDDLLGTRYLKDIVHIYGGEYHQL